MPSPSKQLADRILARLVKEKLISSDSVPSLSPKLASGQLRQDDWRLPIELATEKEPRK